MNVLWLGPDRPALIQAIESKGCTIVRTEDPLTADSEILQRKDWLVSYGYRHLIKPDVLKHFEGRTLNLHIAYLPWNRGADPNLWSFLENTPKGVTIHQIDAGLDTGPIWVQQAIDFSTLPNQTLKTTYDGLSEMIESLLLDSWGEITGGKLTPAPQDKQAGTFHLSKDKAAFETLLKQGFDTPVEQLTGKALYSVS